MSSGTIILAAASAANIHGSQTSWPKEPFYKSKQPSQQHQHPGGRLGSAVIELGVLPHALLRKLATRMMQSTGSSKSYYQQILLWIEAHDPKANWAKAPGSCKH